MKRLFIVVVLLAAGVVGLGFYLGWFSLVTQTEGGKSNVTVTVDKDKIHDDKETAKAKAKEAEQKLKDKAADVAQKVK